MNVATHASSELCALTDSLASSIRWRMRDYEAILRAELALLAEPELTESRAQRFGGASRKI